jgi:succinate dehydrogenase / fumarate reductase membrane anchor subunit
MSGKHKEGPAHWWAMKLTSVALIPLGLWLACNIIQVWLRNPLHAAAIGALLLVGLHHSAYGIQIVMEDYISTLSARRVALFVSNALHLIAAAFGLITFLHALGVGV